MNKRRFPLRLLYLARNTIWRGLFSTLGEYCSGDVLDIGGWDFFVEAVRRKIQFRTWTVLENCQGRLGQSTDRRVRLIQGDGCAAPLRDGQYDTVLCIQVAEHVFEPLLLLRETRRLLRPGGYGVWVVPQTASLHLAPHHYQNFTRFWILEASARVGLEIVELRALGGAWSTAASRQVHSLLQMCGVKELTFPGVSRNLWFYLLWPIAAVYIAATVPLCLLLSLGDMEEEANNHLVVFRRGQS